MEGFRRNLATRKSPLNLLISYNLEPISLTSKSEIKAKVANQIPVSDRDSKTYISSMKKQKLKILFRLDPRMEKLQFFSVEFSLIIYCIFTRMKNLKIPGI